MRAGGRTTRAPYRLSIGGLAKASNRRRLSISGFALFVATLDTAASDSCDESFPSSHSLVCAASQIVYGLAAGRIVQCRTRTQIKAHKRFALLLALFSTARCCSFYQHKTHPPQARTLCVLLLYTIQFFICPPFRRISSLVSTYSFILPAHF